MGTCFGIELLIVGKDGSLVNEERGKPDSVKGEGLLSAIDLGRLDDDVTDEPKLLNSDPSGSMIGSVITFENSYDSAKDDLVGNEGSKTSGGGTIGTECGTGILLGSTAGALDGNPEKADGFDTKSGIFWEPRRLERRETGGGVTREVAVGSLRMTMESLRTKRLSMDMLISPFFGTLPSSLNSLPYELV
jgi:hypothetical protein